MSCQATSGRPSNYEATQITVTSKADIAVPTDEKSDDLKPCPFCGGKAILSSWELLHEHSVSCSRCHAVSGDYEDTREKAIMRWNRRAKE